MGVKLKDARAAFGLDREEEAKLILVSGEDRGPFAKNVDARSHRFYLSVLRRRTPGPSPFSSMKLTPADRRGLFDKP
jgi:hypothetical protein